MDMETGEKKMGTEHEKSNGIKRMELDSKPEAEEDPWALSELTVNTVPWSELDTKGKMKRVLWEWIGRFVVLLLLLYLFICSLSLLSSAFRLVGGKAAGRVFAESELLSNPVCGLMIGVLVTVLVQSSSTSTSIVIAMVGSGSFLDVKQAVPIIMGANIGTSVTNTIVSLAQSGNRNEFRRAFGGATVHDMFNWLCVIILLPIEIASNYLFRMTKAIVETMHLETNEAADKELLSVITKPFTKLIVQIDKSVIEKVALGVEGAEDLSVLKRYCKFNETTELQNVTVASLTADNETVTQIMTSDVPVKLPLERCETLFSLVDWSDAVVGVLLLVIALAILCTCLVLIVKLLHALLRGKIAVVIKKTINANFPGRLSFLTGYVAILVGMVMTILVQSSSIFTSAMTPLVGIGVVSLDRMYPLTLGSNIGTTATGVLAALATSGEKLSAAIQLSLCHLFFNLSGILLWYPIPFMRAVPIRMAKALGNTTAKYRWFAIMYLFLMFFVFPAVVFGLSLAGLWVLVGVGVPIVVLVIAIVIINILQSKRPQWLPKFLRTWNFLPRWMHSLQPLDYALTRMCVCCACCRKLMKPEYTDEKKEVASDTQESTLPAKYPMNGSGQNNPAYQPELDP